jgi:hypothetical protein
VAAAVAVVHLGEHVDGGAEPLDVGSADPDAARRLAGHVAWVGEPAE